MSPRKGPWASEEAPNGCSRRALPPQRECDHSAGNGDRPKAAQPSETPPSAHQRGSTASITTKMNSRDGLRGGRTRKGRVLGGAWIVLCKPRKADVVSSQRRSMLGRQVRKTGHPAKGRPITASPTPRGSLAHTGSVTEPSTEDVAVMGGGNLGDMLVPSTSVTPPHPRPQNPFWAGGTAPDPDLHVRTTEP